MSRANIIDGIYARPLALGNFLHCTVAAFALVKHVRNAEDFQTFIYTAGLL